MAQFRQDRNQVWQNGVLVQDIPVQVDITKEVVELDLATKLRNWYNNNRTFIQTPNASLSNADVVNQVKRLSAEMNALMRMTAFRDLLTDETIDQ